MAVSESEYTINGTCSLNGIPSQSITIMGPYGAQTVSLPGGSYVLFIRVPDDRTLPVTVTASAKGYVSQSREIRLGETSSMDFNLTPEPTVFTVSGICLANGTPSGDIAVYDDTYGERVVSYENGTYKMNISVPYGGSTVVKLIASKDGYEQEVKSIDVNTTNSVDFSLYPLVIPTVSPSASATPTAIVTPATNQSTTGIAETISANIVWIIAAVILLAVVAGAAMYLKKGGGKGGNKPKEPSREDIYKLVTGDTRRRRRPGEDENEGKGHEKLK